LETAIVLWRQAAGKARTKQEGGGGRHADNNKQAAIDGNHGAKM